MCLSYSSLLYRVFAVGEKAFADGQIGMLCTKGQMSYPDFVYFIMSETNHSSQQAIKYWFRCFDMDSDGFVSFRDLQLFYEHLKHHVHHILIQEARNRSNGIADFDPASINMPQLPSFDEVFHELLDLIKLNSTAAEGQQEGFTLDDLLSMDCLYYSGLIFKNLSHVAHFMFWEKRTVLQERELRGLSNPTQQQVEATASGAVSVEERVRLQQGVKPVNMWRQFANEKFIELSTGAVAQNVSNVAFDEREYDELLSTGSHTVAHAAAAMDGEAVVSHHTSSSVISTSSNSTAQSFVSVTEPNLSAARAELFDEDEDDHHDVLSVSSASSAHHSHHTSTQSMIQEMMINEKDLDLMAEEARTRSAHQARGHSNSLSVSHSQKPHHRYNHHHIYGTVVEDDEVDLDMEGVVDDDSSMTMSDFHVTDDEDMYAFHEDGDADDEEMDMRVSDEDIVATAAFMSKCYSTSSKSTK